MRVRSRTVVCRSFSVGQLSLPVASSLSCVRESIMYPSWFAGSLSVHVHLTRKWIQPVLPWCDGCSVTPAVQTLLPLRGAVELDDKTREESLVVVGMIGEGLGTSDLRAGERGYITNRPRFSKAWKIKSHTEKWLQTGARGEVSMHPASTGFFPVVTDESLDRCAWTSKMRPNRRGRQQGPGVTGK